MTTLDFLRRILPSAGVYFLVRVDTYTTPAGAQGVAFKHFPQYSLEQMAATASEFASKKVDIYHACASFVKDQVEVMKDGRIKYEYRKHDNVQAIRSFWQDLDVGEGKPYAQQADAIKALGTFLKETGLPVPLTVSSGHGIHIYWPLTADINPNRWKGIAQKLKLLADKGPSVLHVDPPRSRDMSSILRPVGTSNFKNPELPAEVKALWDGKDNDVAEFEKTIDIALRAAGVDIAEEKRDERAAVSKFDVVQDYSGRRYSGEAVAAKCAQLAQMRDKRGAIPEPQWFHSLEILHFCEDGERLAHAWGSGHPHYSRIETDQKLQQIKGSKVGPTTCQRFETINPDGCAGCPFSRKITTPLALGLLIEYAAPAVVDRQDGKFEVPNPPWPFLRGAGKEAGIWVEDDAEKRLIYPYDLYPYDIVQDEGQGKELVTFRHEQPLVGGVDLRIATEDIYSPVDLAKSFANNHVQLGLGKDHNLMVRYVSGYIQTLRDSTKIRQLYQSMGWKDDGFLLGEQLHTAEGSVKVSVAGSLQKVADGLVAKGDPDAWVKTTELLNQPGWEQFAWLFTTAFGAPLLKMSGYGGAVINAFSSESGCGKTTAARWGSSVYGSWDGLRSSQDSTFNAKIGKLGLLSNLPFYMDEMTTIEPRDIEKLSYSVSDGRGKDRLNRNSKLMDAAEWETFVITTSNARMHAKLQGLKGDSEANCARIFEAEFTRVPAFQALAPQINSFLDQTYGVVGEKYIAELVRRGPEAIRGQINALMAALDRAWGVNGDGKQRFWMVTIAAAAIGAQIAKEIGISAVNVAPTLAWANVQRQAMLGDMKDSRLQPEELVALYYAENSNSIIVAKTLDENLRGRGEKFQVDSLPIGETKASAVLIRIEPDLNRLWLAGPPFRAWLAKGGYDTTSILRKLEEDGLLVSKSRNKRILAGYRGIDETSKHALIPCLELLLKPFDEREAA